MKYGKIIRSLQRFGVVVGYDAEERLIIWPASRVPQSVRSRLTRMHRSLNKQANAWSLATVAEQGSEMLPKLAEHLVPFVFAAVYDELPVMNLKIGTRTVHDLNVFVVAWLEAYAVSYRQGEALEQLNLAHEVWLELEAKLKELPRPEEA